MNNVEYVIFHAIIGCLLGVLFLKLLPIEFYVWYDGCVSIQNTSVNSTVYTNCPVFTQQN